MDIERECSAGTLPRPGLTGGSRPGRFRRAGCVLVLLVAVPAPPLMGAQRPGSGSEEPPYPVPRLAGPIEIDGRVDEPAWLAIPPLGGVVSVPDFGGEPSEATEFRLAHDGEYLYFSCRNFDSEPEGIRATSLRRDDSTFSHDICHLFLDTLNDEENALGFSTNPAGARLDVLFTNDARGPPNFDWNAFWEAAVSRDADGWYAEMRIPFSSLLFHVEGDRVVMGVSMLRNIARRNERITHPAMDPSFGFTSFGRPSGMRKIVLEGVRREEPVYLTPYVLAGSGYLHTLAPERDRYLRRSERPLETGADLRLGLTSNLTLDLTVNTDFAQVEADDQQVNLTRFSLFFPEKRRFFQERNAVFEYSLGGQERVFHSRRVGLVDGTPVRILGGARLVGRVGEWDVGVLQMRTDRSERTSAENLGVVRLRRRAFNANSYVGGILTSRIAPGGRRNLVAGLDGIVRVVGNDYLVVNAVLSHEGPLGTSDSVEPPPLDRSFLRAHWERRGDDGLTYSAELLRAGSGFEPGLGFLRRSGYTSGAGGLGFGWRPGAGSGWLRYGVEGEGRFLRRHEDGVSEVLEATARAVMEQRTGHQFTVTVPVRREDLPRDFPLPGGITLPAGAHTFAQLRVQYRPPQTSRLRPAVTLEGGGFHDGRQWTLSVSPTWTPSMHLNLNGSYRLDVVEFPDRDERLVAHVARLRSEVMLSVRTSAMALIQYNHSGRTLTANVRFRYNAREGEDLYLVWNEGLVVDGTVFDPVPPTRGERTLLVKYSRTFRVRG